MRFFLKSLAAIVLAILIAGVLTYPAWALVSQFADYRPDRVMRRVGMIFLAIALIRILRREGLADRKTFGYGLPRKVFVRQLAVGFACSLVLMLPLVAAIFALNLRVKIEPDMALGLLVVESVIAGFAIAFIEETFMRGAMYSVIERESGIAFAVVLPAILYATVHFMDGKLRIPGGEMSFLGGLQIAAHTFERFAAPVEIMDTFLALFALGILLALVRRRTGAIAGGIGLHAGGVAVIAIVHGVSMTNPNATMPWLVGTYDGFIGWLAFVWIALVTYGYSRVARVSSK